MVACTMGSDKIGFPGKTDNLEELFLMLVKRNAVRNTVLQVLPVSEVVRGLNRTHRWTALALFSSLYKVLRMEISIESVGGGKHKISRQ